MEGVQNIGNAAAADAKNDLQAAIVNAQNRASTGVLSGDVGGLTLTPGVYTVPSSLEVTGTLTLDAQFDPTAAWIFQIGSTLNINTGGKVKMINKNSFDLDRDNVWWVVGSSCTINTAAELIGVVMADQSISTSTDCTTGPLLAKSGAVTVQTVEAYSYDNIMSPLSVTSLSFTEAIPSKCGCVPLRPSGLCCVLILCGVWRCVVYQVWVCPRTRLTWVVPAATPPWQAALSPILEAAY